MLHFVPALLEYHHLRDADTIGHDKNGKGLLGVRSFVDTQDNAAFVAVFEDAAEDAFFDGADDDAGEGAQFDLGGGETDLVFL